MHQRNDSDDAEPELDGSDLQLWNLQEELLAKTSRFARLTKQDSQHYMLTDAQLKKLEVTVEQQPQPGRSRKNLRADDYIQQYEALLRSDMFYQDTYSSAASALADSPAA